MVHSLNKIYKFGQVEYDLSNRTHIMGILNVTPDSFSDGGKYLNSSKAVDYALKMIDEGADFIDVGGESTRPGSESVSVEDEINRVIPVIEQLSKATNIPISIDTTKSAVAEKALQSGAVIVNDISSYHFDNSMPAVISKYHASVVLMHTKDKPKTMQHNPEYQNLIGEIKNYLAEAIKISTAKDINQIIIDPGIGFGKKIEHNIEIFKRLKDFQEFGYPILVGPSRKSFIGELLDLPIDGRLEGTAAAVAVSIMNGANIIRVHDVKEMKRVSKIVDALK
ncbi:MAG: dihydropteroate synthase [Bacteroidota bacterium]|nr:dihydropteroate synthase [Bacteroidota bacterium]